MPSPRKPSKPSGCKVTFFQAISANRDSAENKIRLYKSCGDFLAGADLQACVPDVIADLNSDWGLAASELEKDVRSSDPQLVQYVLYFAGNLLSNLDLMADCPQTAQRRLILMLLRHGVRSANHKETFKMAAWCLSCQRATRAAVSDVLSELIPALAGILQGTPMNSRLAQQYALTALSNLLEQSPSQAIATATAWVPGIMKVVLEATSGGGNQTAVLRRDARGVLQKLVTAIGGSSPDSLSDCVADVLLSHGLLGQMESAVQTVCAMAPKCSGCTPPPELAIAVDAVASWALFVQLLGRRFLRGKDGTGSSAAGQRMLKVIQSTFTIQRSALVGLPVVSFYAWGDLAGMLQAQGELPVRRVSGLILVPILHAITNHIQPDVHKAAVGAWQRVLQTLGERLEDPDLYTAVVSDVLEACVSLVSRNSQPLACGASWIRQMGVLREVCDGLSSHLHSGGSSQQGQSETTTTRQQDVVPWLAASPSRCIDLLRSCARLEEASHAACSALTSSALEKYTAVRRAIVDLWQCAAIGVAGGLQTSSPEGAETACWLRAVREEADLMLTVSASRTRRLPAESDGQELAVALGDFERRLVCQQLEMLQTIPAWALTSEEAASPIGRILWGAVCQAGAMESPQETGAPSGPPFTPSRGVQVQPAASPCLSPGARGLGSAGKAVMRFLMAAPETAVPRTPSTPFSQHGTSGRSPWATPSLRPSATPPGDGDGESQSDAGPPLSPSVKIAAASMLIHTWAPLKATSAANHTLLSAVREMMARLISFSGSSSLGTAASLTAALLQLSDGILYLAQRPGKGPMVGQAGSRRSDRLLDGLLTAWTGSMQAALALVSEAGLANAGSADEQTLSCHALLLIPLKCLATFEAGRCRGHGLSLVPHLPETWQELCRVLFSLDGQQGLCRRHLREFLRHNLQWRSLPVLGGLLDLAAQQLGAASIEELEVIMDTTKSVKGTSPLENCTAKVPPAGGDGTNDVGNLSNSPERPVQADGSQETGGETGACLQSALSPSPAPQARTKAMTTDSFQSAMRSMAANAANLHGSQACAADQYSQPGSQGTGRQMLLDSTRGAKKPHVQSDTVAVGLVASAEAPQAEEIAACPLAGSSGTAAFLGPVCATSISRRLASAGTGSFSKATNGSPAATLAAAANQRAPKLMAQMIMPKRKAVRDLLDSSQSEYVVITTKKTRLDTSLMTERQQEVFEKQRRGLKREGLTLYTSLDPASQSQHCSLQTTDTPRSPPRPSRLARPAEPVEAAPAIGLTPADGARVPNEASEDLLPQRPEGSSNGGSTMPAADNKAEGRDSGDPEIMDLEDPANVQAAVTAGDGPGEFADDGGRTTAAEPLCVEEAVLGTPQEGADNGGSNASSPVALTFSPDSNAKPVQAGRKICALQLAGHDDSSLALGRPSPGDDNGKQEVFCQPPCATDVQPDRLHSSETKGSNADAGEDEQPPVDVCRWNSEKAEGNAGAEAGAMAVDVCASAAPRADGQDAGETPRAQEGSKPEVSVPLRGVLPSTCARGPSDLDIRELELMGTQEMAGSLDLRAKFQPHSGLADGLKSSCACVGALAGLSKAVLRGGLEGASDRELLTAQSQLTRMLSKVSTQLMAALDAQEDPSGMTTA